MKYTFSKKFGKKFSKLPEKIKKQSIKKFELFIKNPFDKKINNHKLSGQLKDLYSINISGDYRAVYRRIDFEMVEFIDVGTHSELYS